MPARTEPVIETICGVGCSTSARPVSRSPETTLSTPGGRNSWQSSAEQHRRGGGGVRGLEHDGVAGRERGPDLPDHHHQRVVPGRHLADDADRLAPDHRGVVGHVLPGRPALEHPGGAGEEADLVDGRRQLLRRGQARAACRCCGTRPRRTRRPAPRARRRSSAGRAGARPAWSRPRPRRPWRPRRRRGRRPRRPTSGPRRRPRRWSGRSRRRSRPTRRRSARR